jgi:large subunit ribosomal protein L13
MDERKRMSTTYSPKQGEVERRWHVVDAAGVPLGRLSTAVARLLVGKHKPEYAPHEDTGDFVIVLNAAQVLLTGGKEGGKMYHRTSGRPGGMKSEAAEKLRARFPERLVEKAVKGMLPKNKLGRRQHRKLKVYAGGEHPHQAQKPAVHELQVRRAG